MQDRRNFELRNAELRILIMPAGSRNSHFAIPHFAIQRNLPMINEKKTSELLETSLIYLLSAAVAVGAFVLVWLISLVLGPGRA